MLDWKYIGFVDVIWIKTKKQLRQKRQPNCIDKIVVGLLPNMTCITKNWLSASHTRALRVPYLFLVFVVIAATIIHHP